MLTRKIAAEGLLSEDAQSQEIARCKALVESTVSNHLEELRALTARMRALRTKLDDDAVPAQGLLAKL